MLLRVQPNAVLWFSGALLGPDPTCGGAEAGIQAAGPNRLEISA
jgi:hypothetical protein